MPKPTIEACEVAGRALEAIRADVEGRTLPDTKTIFEEVVGHDEQVRQARLYLVRFATVYC